MTEREQPTAVPFGAPPSEAAAADTPEPVENPSERGEITDVPGTAEVLDGEPVDPAGAPVSGADDAVRSGADDAARSGTDDAEMGESGPGGHEEVVRDLEELAARAEKADEYLALAQRTRADFENFRKRAARDAALAQERGIAKLAKELLPAIDNLDRAVAAAESADGSEESASQFAAGVKLVHAELLAALARAGIVSFSPDGETFDPNLHEAVAQVPREETVAGTVIEVYQQGYRLGESVLRPAKVLVAA
jgi:molecular chaperone GrpE